MHGCPFLAFIMGDRAGQQVPLQVNPTKSKTTEYKVVPATTLKPPQLNMYFLLPNDSPPPKTRLHDKTDAFCQQNALTWRMRQGQVYSTIWTLITFYGSHFEKKYLKKEIVHIYLKGLEFQFQKKFNLTKCLKSLAENSIMTLLWSEKRARKLQEYSGTILHSPTGRLKRTAKGCFLYLNCVSNF